MFLCKDSKCCDHVHIKDIARLYSEITEALLGTCIAKRKVIINKSLGGMKCAKKLTVRPVTRFWLINPGLVYFMIICVNHVHILNFC